MMYFETPSGLRLRPVHVLLMIYRYVCGIYQVGDLSALNYLKGLIDGRGSALPERILSVSGHGIGEAERWLIDRFPEATVESVSFRLVDTQLLHFLRRASAEDIRVLFDQFSEAVRPLGALETLAADPGLVPYWAEQASTIGGVFATERVTVYSDTPTRIPASRTYDVVYVSHASPWLTAESIDKLRRQVVPEGLLCALLPGRGDSASGRFADGPVVAEARARFHSALSSRGYPLDQAERKPPPDLSALSARREAVTFDVLAPAQSVLVGELILSTLHERISDRDRLAALDDVATAFAGLSVPVTEELEVYIMDGDR